ncbi:hypothetical protein C8R46DRAFT_1127389, partial [Mycena filopes]
MGQLPVTPGATQGGTSPSASAHPTHRSHPNDRNRQSQDDPSASNAGQSIATGNVNQDVRASHAQGSTNNTPPRHPRDGTRTPDTSQNNPPGSQNNIPSQGPSQGGLQDYTPPRDYPGAASAKAGKRKKTLKASIKVSALNIKGIGHANAWHPQNKWYHVWQTMREQKIGVLVVGEAHLNDARCSSIRSLFGRKLEIEFSKDPNTPNAKGIAIVLNKNFINVDGIKTTEIIPGRALHLEFKGRGDKPFAILGVYAPNSAAENATFWRDIHAFFEANPNIRRPDALAGDLNFVEDALDRLPSREDPA